MLGKLGGCLLTFEFLGSGLVLAEYFRSGNVVSVREVNGEEPIFPKVSFFNVRLRGSKVLQASRLARCLKFDNEG